MARPFLRLDDGTRVPVEEYEIVIHGFGAEPADRIMTARLAPGNGDRIQCECLNGGRVTFDGVVYSIQDVAFSGRLFVETTVRMEAVGSQ